MQLQSKKEQEEEAKKDESPFMGWLLKQKIRYESNASVSLLVTISEVEPWDILYSANLQ